MFKSTTACIISGLGLILSSFLSPAYSATIENGGVIHFVARWSLTDAPASAVAISCRKNNRMKTHTISYDEALRGHHPHSALAICSADT